MTTVDILPHVASGRPDGANIGGAVKARLFRWLLLSGAAVFALLPQRALAQETLLSAKDLAGGRLEIHKILSTPSRNVAIWLPPGYEESDQRYPVAFLLHGFGGSYEAFSDAPGSVARLMGDGRIEPVILVMPNRSSQQWIDPEFWDFIATDLVSFTDRNFRTMPERGRRAIGGHSMGGMDALTIALLRPDVFRYAGGIDGARCTPCQLDRPELIGLLKLHKQYLFPLSLWIQWGTASFLPSPRPVLDVLDVLHFPYVYLETGDDHDSSYKNTTDDFLVFFSDGMRSGAAEPPLPGRVTEHFVAVAGSSLDIEVDLRGASADPGADLRVDLSEVGAEPVLLEHDGSGRYTGRLRLPDEIRNGRYILPVMRVGGTRGPEYVYGMRITVYPSSDLVIFDEGVGPGWSAGTMRRVEEVDLAADEVVFAGRTAAMIHGQKSFTGWAVPFVADDTASAVGYSLRFAFAPGAVTLAEKDRFTVGIGNHGIALRERVDFTRPEWQVVEIPLDSLGLEKEAAGYGGFTFGAVTFSAVTFSGTFEGTFYVDDLRLVAPQLAAAPTAVLEERSDRRPQAFALQQNFPNPFNSGTVIRFELPADEEVELAVFNLAGQQVATLVEGVREGGSYAINWDGRDDRGQELASGVYLYRLRAGERMETRRLLLLR